MLRLDNVSKTYMKLGKTIRAMDGVSLAVDAGQLVAVHGPSGSGKTTLLLATGALLRPDEGAVTLAGQDPYAMRPDQRAALRAETVGFVFQRYHLIPYLSVLDNVLAASLALPADGARGRATELVERFGLGERMHHVPAELSAGERQRTALARALLNRPRLLLADEPTGNLDERNAEIVLSALTSFAAAGGAVLAVTHDPRASALAPKTLAMRDGQIRDD